MPAPEALLGFAVASLVLIVIPGPSVLFAIARSLSLGRRAGVVTVAGNTLGQVPLILAVAFGVGAIIAQSAMLFLIVKLCGAAYLAYLGVQAIRMRNMAFTPDDADRHAAASPALTLRKIFWQGFVVGVTNPKSIVFFLAVLPQFVTPATGSIPLQMMVLGGVFVLIAMMSDSIYALLAGTARAWFTRSPRRATVMQTTSGVLLIGLGGALLFASHTAS